MKGWRGRRLCLLLLFALASPLSAQTEVGGDFSLTDQYGHPFSLQQMRGKLVLLFFGYTYCPDVCPAELANLASLFDALGPQSERVQGLFVSLDPQRDSPEVLRSYTRYFSQNLLGLTGSVSEVDRVAQQYHVKYQRHEQKNGRYSLDHSANLYVIDSRGELAVVVPYGLPPEHVLQLVLGMLEEGDR
jgi:cytochrome oxidase Cu insertion factor (SCO1/SenC/PrrC family)